MEIDFYSALISENQWILFVLSKTVKTFLLNKNYSINVSDIYSISKQLYIYTWNYSLN
jgi:hypothetical protein